MMKKRYFLFILLLAVALAAILGGCGSSGTNGSSGTSGQPGSSHQPASTNAGKRVFKISHTGSETHVWSKTMNVFKEELEKRSEGRLSLDLYLNSTLGNNPEMLQQMKAGSLDMAFIPVAELTNRYASFNAWFMPFLFNDLKHAIQMSQTDEALSLLHEVWDENQEGIHGLGYVPVGMRQVLMKEHPVASLADLKGVKIRVSSGSVVTEWWKKTGASPTSVPLSEVYTALQTGVVDGIDIDLVAMVSEKFYEVGKQLTLTNHMPYFGVAFVSKAVWDQLNDADKKIIQEAFAAAQQFNYQQSITDENESVNVFNKAGGTVTEVKNRDEFVQLAEQFISGYASGDPKIDAFVKKANEIGSK